MSEILSVLGGVKSAANAVDVKPLQTTSQQGTSTALYVVFAVLLILILSLIFISAFKK